MFLTWRDCTMIRSLYDCISMSLRDVVVLSVFPHPIFPHGVIVFSCCLRGMVVLPVFPHNVVVFTFSIIVWLYFHAAYMICLHLHLYSVIVFPRFLQGLVLIPYLVLGKVVFSWFLHGVVLLPWFLYIWLYFHDSLWCSCITRILTCTWCGCISMFLYMVKFNFHDFYMLWLYLYDSYLLW